MEIDVVALPLDQVAADRRVGLFPPSRYVL